MLRINIETYGKKAILHCTGRVVFGIELETLRRIVKSRTEQQLQLDLSEVGTVDAAGLGLLVELQSWAVRQKRTLTFVNASDLVQRLVFLTRLNHILPLHIEDRRRRQLLQQDARPAALIA
jgi:anti-anti-sigma factor